MHNIYDVLQRPIFTEKSSNLRDTERKVLVEVASWANKHQISQAIKAMFGVDVLNVNTLRCRGKVKRVKNSVGKMSNIKKAYITLKSGSDVDLFGVVGQEVARAEESRA